MKVTFTLIAVWDNNMWAVKMKTFRRTYVILSIWMTSVCILQPLPNFCMVPLLLVGQKWEGNFLALQIQKSNIWYYGVVKSKLIPADTDIRGFYIGFYKHCELGIVFTTSFSYWSPSTSSSAAAPGLHPLQLLLPNCVHFSYCSLIASADCICVWSRTQQSKV